MSTQFHGCPRNSTIGCPRNSMKEKKTNSGGTAMRHVVLLTTALVSLFFSCYYLQHFVDYFSAYSGYFIGGVIIPVVAGLFFGILADKLSRKLLNPIKSWILFVVASVSALLPPIYLLLAVTFLDNL